MLRPHNCLSGLKGQKAPTLPKLRPSKLVQGQGLAFGATPAAPARSLTCHTAAYSDEGPSTSYNGSWPVGFGFSAGGLLFPYFLGVTSGLEEAGALTHETPVAGEELLCVWFFFVLPADVCKYLGCQGATRSIFCLLSAVER